jgi:hypothetical protein
LKSLILVTLVAVLIYPRMTFASQNNENTPSETKKRKAICNLRIQYRRQINNDTIADENDIQATFFTGLPHSLFLFMNAEAIYSGTDYHSGNSELNLSRPLFPYYKPLSCLEWTSRIQIETDMKNELALGLQWQIHKTPGLSRWARKYKTKVFVQVFPIKSTNERGEVDAYLYYAFPLPGGVASTRGFARQYFSSEDSRDYKMIAQDLIFPITKSWDLYLRYAYYDRIRNSGYGVGIRYLFSL